MATWYLINAVIVGGVQHYPGEYVDDAIDSTDYAAAGGVLWASGNAVVAAAAAQAQNMRARGASLEAMGVVMSAAVDSVQRTNDLQVITLDVPQATSAIAVVERVIGKIAVAGTLASVHFTPDSTSTPAGGANSQLLEVSKRDGAGGAAVVLAAFTIANATPATQYVPAAFAIAQSALALTDVLTFKTTLTGTATLPAGVITIKYAPTVV
jgi:hypothetical protein